MKDEEATKDKEPILDSRGLMCDVQQLRHVAHQLACAMNQLLGQVPGLEMVLGEALYTSLIDETVRVHSLTCDKHKVELPREEDPTWRLFNPTND